MILKKITLNNIRSYEQQEIEFPEGSTLLSGDIGAGKTSILLAIEFALFGLQPGQRGAALLRNGKTNGGVIIEFEVDGKKVMIERTLKKGKTISQDYCSVTIDDKKKEISVTELKNLVLELLNYPKEFSKKQNILYKFTVYTPQEQMKQIILQDPKTRINTLRHVFGIDKYKTILENASIIISKIKEERKLKEGIIINLDQDKLDIIEKENELEAKHYNLSSIEKELFLKQEKRKKIEEEKKEISKKIEEKVKFNQEIEKDNIVISNKKESILDNKNLIEQLKNQVNEFKKLKFDESKIKELEKEIELIKKQQQEFNDKNLQITSQITSLNFKNQENEKLKEKLAHIEICPTCLQDVDPVYKANVINKIDSDTVENTKKIEPLVFEKKKISEKIIKINFEISLKEKQVRELNIIKIKQQEIKEKQKRIKELEKINILLEKDIELLNQHVETLNKSVFEIKKFDNIFETKQKEFEKASNQERLAEIKVAELKREIQVFSKQVDELKIKIKKTEETKEQLNYLIKLEDWLSNKFITLMSFIEKNVMTKLKAEFSRLFSKWFSMLVSESFNVRLNDDFTPIVEYNDYEIEYIYLSGGERTAIALAYRLALNQVINSLLSKIKTKDLVILDEPTDGFSENQLDKMRDVLQELNINQLIIVSHEQKIESFVENIIRFKKEKGVSQKE